MKAFDILTHLVLVLVVSGVGIIAQSTPADIPAKLSIEEGLRVDNLKLRTALAQSTALYDGCRAEVGVLYDVLGRTRAQQATKDLTEAEAQLKTEIERAHPGYVFDPKTGALAKVK